MLKAKALRGLKWSFVENVYVSAAQLIQIALLARFLDKADFGLIAVATVIVGFTNIFAELGISSALLHVQKATNKEYSSLYWLTLCFALLLYLIIYFSAPYVAIFYNMSELVLIVQVLGLNIIFITLGSQHSVFLQKSLAFDKLAKIRIASVTLSMIAAIWLAVAGYGVYSLVISTLLASLAFSICVLAARIRSYPILIHFDIRETKQFIRIGLYGLGSNALDFLSREIDTLLIGKFYGESVLGVYSLAKNLVAKVYSLIVPVIFRVFNPLLASMNSDLEKVDKYFLVILKGVSYVSVPLFFAISIFSLEIMTYFYGVEYAGGAIILMYLALYKLCFVLVKPSGSLQIATGRTDLGFAWTILRSVLTVVVVCIGASYLTINGLAMTLSCLGVLLVVILWPSQIKYMSNIRFGHYAQALKAPLISYVLLLLTFDFYVSDILLSLEMGTLARVLLEFAFCILAYPIMLRLLDKDAYHYLIRQVSIFKRNK